jgi:hypothetical protein
MARNGRHPAEITMHTLRRLSILTALVAIAAAASSMAQSSPAQTVNVSLVIGRSATFGTDYPFGSDYVPGPVTYPAAARGRFTQDTVNKLTPNGTFSVLGGVITIPKVSQADQGTWTITYEESYGQGSQTIQYIVKVITPPPPASRPKPQLTPTPTPKARP